MVGAVACCFIGLDPACKSKEECRKGDVTAKTLCVVFAFVIPYFVLPGVIVTTMVIMYCRVLAQEKKVRKYGIGALELRKKNKKKDNDRRNDKYDRHTRAVIHRALSYCLVFFFTYLFPIISSICTLVTKGDYDLTLGILTRVFVYPLQGFFNFVMFIYPKVLHAKNNTNRHEGGISWIGAFTKAITSTK